MQGLQARAAATEGAVRTIASPWQMGTGPLALASLAALVMCSLPAADAWAQRGGKPKGKTTGEVAQIGRGKTKEKRDKGDKGAKGPKEVQGRRLRQRSSLEDIDDEVDILRELLDIERGSPTEADTLLELSYVLWDRAEAYELEAYDSSYTVGIEQAKKNGETATARRLQIEQQNLLEEARGTKLEVIDNLKRIERRFRFFNKLDEVLYTMGWHLNDLKRHGEAVDAFMRLVRKTPKSAYMPDAYLGIGNYYFGKNQGGESLKWYNKVLAYKQSDIYGWGLYYIGWVHYNRQDYEEAVKTFVQVLDYSANEANGRITFFEDGTKYLVKSWAEVGTPTGALNFFKKAVPGQELALLDALARHYTETSQYQKSSIVLNELIRLTYNKPKSVEYLYLTVENYYKAADLEGTIGAIERLSLGLLKHGTEAVRAEDISLLLAEIATTFHAESERTLDMKVLRYAEKIYSAYIEHFASDTHSYDMLHNHALALFQLERWRDSATRYEEVIKAMPDGKYAEPSAHRALICYLRLEKDLNSDISKKVDDLLNPIKLAEEEMLIASACDRYVSIARKKGTKEDVPEAIFVEARIYYQHNYFDKSGELFTLFVDNYKDHKHAYIAARLMLSSFNLAQDGKNLIKWTNELIRDDRFNRGKLGEILIAIKENEDYNRCLELKSEPMKAARCLLDYASQYPTSKQAIRAYAGAARFYREARQRDLVIKTYRQLAENYPKDDRAPKAMFAIAEVHQETANFAAAADAYEQFVETYPKYKGKIGEELMVPKALATATVIREGLGQFDKVVLNAERYLKYFKGNRDANDVAYKLTLQYRKQNDWRGVIRASGTFLKRGADIPLHLRMAAMSNTALSWSKIKGGDRKAQKLADDVLKMAKKMNEEGTFKKLAQIGKDAVAQALFVNGELIFNQMQRVKVRARKLTDAVVLATKKAELATKAGESYVEVENSKNAEWVAAAASRRGRAFHEIAIALENLPPPPEFRRLDELKDQWYAKMADRAAPYKVKAKERYEEALKKSAQFFAFDKYWEQARDYLKELDPDFATRATILEKTVDMSKVVWTLDKKPRKVIEDNRLALFGRQSADLQVKMSDADRATQSSQTARTFNDMALAHHVQGEHRDALMVAAVGMNVANAPELAKDSKFLTMLGMSHLALGNIRPALMLFKRAGEADEKALTPLLNSASVQFKYLDLDGAAKVLQTAVARDPKHYWARASLPVALRRLGKSEEAMAMLDEVVADYPAQADAHYNRCVIAQAVLTGTRPNVERALKTCEEAVAVAKKRSPEAKELRKRAQGLKDTLEFMDPAGAPVPAPAEVTPAAAPAATP